MKVKSIIKAETPTKNKRIYTLADLEKILDHILPMVLKNNCFIWFGMLHPNDINANTASGIVKNVELIDGQLYFDIELFPNKDNEALIYLYNLNLLGVDFNLIAKTSDKEDEDGNKYLDLTDMKITHLSLKKVD